MKEPPAKIPEHAARMVPILLATVLLLTGCRSIAVKEDRKCATGINPGEAIAVVMNFSSDLSYQEAHEAEKRLSGCIASKMAIKHPQCRVIPPDEFRAGAFPGLDFASAPHTPASFSLLIDHPVFRARARTLGVRYLVLVGGGTTSKKKSGDIWCGAGYGGGGCLGLVIFDQTSRNTALVFDLTGTGQAGEVRATVSGRPWFSMLAILPLGFPAFTEGRACDELGEGVARFIGGAGPVPKGAPGRDK